MQGSGYRVQGAGFRVQGLGFQVCTREKARSFEPVHMSESLRLEGGSADHIRQSRPTHKTVEANMEHIRQSRPGSGLGFQTKVPKIL